MGSDNRPFSLGEPEEVFSNVRTVTGSLWTPYFQNSNPALRHDGQLTYVPILTDLWKYPKGTRWPKGADFTDNNATVRLVTTSTGLMPFGPTVFWYSFDQT